MTNPDPSLTPGEEPSPNAGPQEQPPTVKPSPAAPKTPPASRPVPVAKGHLPPSPNKAVVVPPRPAAKVDLQIQFPNGSVGKPYDVQKNLLLYPSGESTAGFMAVCERIDGLVDIGLRAELAGDRIRISGTPTKPGDHPLTVVYTIRKSQLELGSLTKQLTLTVNPDPRTLWKDLEPEPDQPFFKEHCRTERLEGPMVLLGASRRGRSHAHEAKFREDDFRLGNLPDGWHYLAVADGAGSSKFSRRGSELACETVCAELSTRVAESLTSAFDGHLMEYRRAGGGTTPPAIGNALYKVLGGAGHAAYRRIESEARGHNCPIKDFATTLNVTICRRYDADWFVAVFAVGDGGVGVLRTNAEVSVLSTPDSGEFAGQTRFLTMSEIWSSGKDINERIRFAVVPDLKAVVAMTDGVSDPKFATDKNFLDPARWLQLWADLKERVTLSRENEHADTELLDWLDFWSVGNHDDRTIALMLP